VTHPSATELESCPPSPVRLTCVRHAASVRPEPGSNSPMNENSYSSLRTTGKFRVVRITSESNPLRHASDRAPLNRGRTPHTRSSILKERLRKKFVARL